MYKPIRRRDSVWRLTPARIAAAFALFGALWVVGIHAVSGLGPDVPAAALRFEALVSVVFILITAVLLYVLLRWSFGALGESERVLTTLVSNVPGMVYRCRNDRDRTMLFLSDGCRDVTGYHRSDLLGSRDVSYAELIIPPDRDRVWSEVQQALRDDRPFELTYRIRTADGDERWVWERGVAVRKAEEDDVLLEGFIADITDRRRAEQVNALLATAVEHAGEGILITDRNGTILYANPALESITGYSRKDLVGLNPRIFKSGEHDTGFYKDMWDTLSRGEVWSARLINRRRDGTLYEERQTISPVRDADGNTVNYVAVKRDVTEIVSLENQLRHTQKLDAIGKLAGGIAHDFNNLLMAIMGHCELMLGQTEEGSPQYKDLLEIKNSTIRAAALTRQLLAFSRRQVVEPRLLDLNMIISEMKTMLERLIGTEVELIARLDAELGPVRADASQIEQVIMNLVVNGRDAMPYGGKLVIETANVELDESYAAAHVDVEPGPYAMLAVSDTGTGIQKAIQPRVFEPFFSTKGGEKGTGLGLSTVYGIVKQSGGSIWLNSEPGRGTTFKIYLPLAGDSDRPTASAAVRLRGAPARSEEAVLVVENDAHVHGSMAEKLGRAGYLVLEAKGPEDALGLCREFPERIGLMVADLRLPGTTGPELAERIRTFRPELRAIYISGHVESSALGPEPPAGDDCYLQKPFATETLLRRVHELLQPREADRPLV